MRTVAHTILFLILTLLGSVTYTYAQLSSTIAVSPKNPLPKSKVTLTLESYTFDVNTAIITWKINGEQILKGQGQKTVTVQLGEVGQSASVSVIAETADGSSLENRLTLAPSSVTLLYEAPKSYVPLLYEGRSLPSTGALVRVSALPEISDNGTLVSPSNLSYTWYLNDTVIKSVSGLGKQAASIRLDYLASKNEVKVIARSPLGNTATKSTVIIQKAIMPIFYTYDAVLGPNTNKAIERRFEAVEDFTLSLEPFYVSDKETKQPTYTWFLDGLPTTPLGGKLLGLHPKENSYGTKMLSVLIQGPDKRIQKKETKVELIFDTRK